MCSRSYRQAWKKIRNISAGFCGRTKILTSSAERRMVADRKAVYYFVDGFLKESIVEKLLEFFYSVTPEDLPEDSEELSRDAMPYVEVELLEDCEQITNARFYRA